MRRALRLIIVLTLLGTCQIASAYSISWVGQSNSVVKWKINTVEYYLHQGNAPGITNFSNVKAVRQAFTDWQSVTCSKLAFKEINGAVNRNAMMVSFTCNSDNQCYYGDSNNKNELAWMPDWIHGPYVLGITTPTFSLDGTINEADIGFNGKINWTTTPSGNNQRSDVLSIALHEIGHFFGMQHVLSGYDQSTPPIMAPAASALAWQSTRIIKDDDRLGVCYLYPKNTFSCSSDADCPYVVADSSGGQEFYQAKYRCKSGTCQTDNGSIPSANKDIGEACQNTQYDCKSGLFCQQYGAQKFCTKNCNPQSDDCPNGYQCVGFSNSSGGACVPGTTNTGGNNTGGTVITKKVGETCGYTEGCESTLVCIGEGTDYRCRQKCNTGNPSCPNGTYCAAIQNGGACIPGSTPVTDKKNGESCQSGNDCASKVCASEEGSNQFLCRQGCDPNKTECPTGETCVGFVGSAGGACTPETGDNGGNTGQPAVKRDAGAPCAGNTECVSNQCIKIGSSDAPAFCTANCTQQSECPCGMECQAVNSGGNLCLTGRRIACVDKAQSCSDSSECKTGVCSGGFCGEPCDISKSNCDSPFRCRREKRESTVGTCVSIGSKANGESCNTDGDCASLFCEDPGNGKTICLIPCLADKQTCAAGQSCAPVFNNLGGCFLPNGTPAPSPELPQPTTSGGGTGASNGSKGCSVSYWRGGGNLGWVVMLLLFMGLLYVGRRQTI